MKTSLLLVLGLLLCAPTHAEERNRYKQDVTLWYEAFTKKDPALLDRSLGQHWVDIPAPPINPPDQQGRNSCSLGSPPRFLICI